MDCVSVSGMGILSVVQMDHLGSKFQPPFGGDSLLSKYTGLNVSVMADFHDE